jgi:type VI protein secretion system component Hcp
MKSKITTIANTRMFITMITISILFAAQLVTAQVGIGTTSPNASSILDLSSPDKGLLLPRVNDTTAVSNPSAGLMVYDLNAHSPAFHNGSKWNALAGISSALSATSNDSITYTFFGPNSFVQGTFSIVSLYTGGSNSGSSAAYMQDVSFLKYKDVNTVNFMKTMVSGTMVGGIEFKMYVPGATTPYYSVKLSNWEVSSDSQSMSIGGELVESISLAPQIIGYKDWVNNISFSYNLTTFVIGNY